MDGVLCDCDVFEPCGGGDCGLVLETWYEEDALKLGAANILRTCSGEMGLFFPEFPREPALLGRILLLPVPV